MSKALSFKEFAEIVNYISEKRSMISNDVGYPYVKYIDSVFDMRTNTVFSIRFRGPYEKQFSCVNGERYLTDSMYERIMQWLSTKNGSLIKDKAATEPKSKKLVTFICTEK